MNYNQDAKANRGMSRIRDNRKVGRPMVADLARQRSSENMNPDPMSDEQPLEQDGGGDMN